MCWWLNVYYYDEWRQNFGIVYRNFRRNQVNIQRVHDDEMFETFSIMTLQGSTLVSAGGTRVSVSCFHLWMSNCAQNIGFLHPKLFCPSHLTRNLRRNWPAQWHACNTDHLQAVRVKISSNHCRCMGKILISKTLDGRAFLCLLSPFPFFCVLFSFVNSLSPN